MKKHPIKPILTETVLDARLPHGYADPDHELYVPEEFRDAYALALPEQRSELVKSGPWMEIELARVARSLARAVVVERLGEQPEAPARRSFQAEPTALEVAYATALAERQAVEDAEVNRLEVEEYFRLQNLAVHYRASAAAELQVREEHKREQERARVVAERTCPICGQHADSAETGAPVSARNLAPHYPTAGGHNNYPRLRSCTFCYDEALAQLREQRADAASLVDFRHPTRRDAVKVALSH